MKNVRSLSAFSILFLALGLASCSSKQTTTSSAEDQYPADDVQEQGLVLNGDSDTGKAGALRTVYFAYDSSTLSEDAKAKLESNAEFLKSNESVEVQIEGHADERGGIEYNLALGQRRAQTVKSYLQALGVSGNRITIVSYGKERPLVYGHDESAWSKNRRANFVVTAK